MNILLVNWMDMANPMAGGAEVHLTEIFKRFAARGDRVTLVASGFPGCSKTDEYEGIRIIRTGTRETFNFAAPKLLMRLHRRERFDLVVEDINKVPLFTPLYLKSPILVIIPHLFGTTVFHETNPLFASYVYMMECPIPYVYKNAMFEVISKSTAADIARRGIRKDRIRVVHCGMDHDTYTPGDGTVKKFDRPTVLYVGRIKKYKSVDVVIRAMPAVCRVVPHVRLVIVGSGDNLPELKRLAGGMDICSRVDFPGFVSMKEKVDWMRRSHVIVNPSPKEGWGLTNIEANACGTVAVASDADGLRDSVRNGETGFLFPYGDHTTCAERIIRLLTDHPLMERMTKNALEWSNTFTWDACAEDTMQVVDELAG